MTLRIERDVTACKKHTSYVISKITAATLSLLACMLMHETDLSTAGGIRVAVDGREVVRFTATSTSVDTRNVE